MMQIKGTIIKVLPRINGVSKAGKEWQKAEYIIQPEGQYAKPFKFDLFGENADKYPLVEYQVVTLSIDLESREFNGRWYTDVHAWRVEVEATPNTAPTPAPAIAPPKTNDLPF